MRVLKSRAAFALILGLLLPSLSSASVDFPFQISKSSSGKIATIEIPARAAFEESTLLSDLRRAHDEMTIANFDDEHSAGTLADDERATFEEAKAFMARSFAKKDIDDPRLDTEFTKAQRKLASIKVFRLVASPYDVAAFDKENTVAKAIEEIMNAAKLVFDFAPPMKVFEFLIDQHIENLQSRREFHQNRLLLWLEESPASFTSEEADLIRSSIHYSRISILDSVKRKAARANWKKFGSEKTRAITKKCTGFASSKERTFGPCFKIVGHEIRNGMVKYNLTSSSTSHAYDYDRPTRLRDGRIGWLLLKLGLKFVPAPRIIKKGVSTWMNSHYEEQRRSEGFLYEAARRKGESNLASWIAIGSANPILEAR